MLTCIPCPSTRGLIKDITHHLKFMSFKAVRMQHRRRKEQQSKETAAAVAADVGEEDEEWVAEAEHGVLITLLSLPDGGNHLKKIRFSEELFDAREAQRWWAANCDKITELYSIRQPHEPPTPHQSDVEDPVDSMEAHESESSSDAARNLDGSPPAYGPDLPPLAPSAGGAEGKMVEWVVEDEPGVFLTIRSLTDGSRRELLRVELSRERFGEVKARVWWEENKARLHQQYS